MERSLTQTQREWAARVARWQESKLGRGEFAAREGIAGERLTWWRWKLKNLGVIATEKEAASTGPSFVRLEAAGCSGREEEQAEPLELVLCGGQRVRIPVGFDAGTLTRVLAIIARGEA